MKRVIGLVVVPMIAVMLLVGCGGGGGGGIGTDAFATPPTVLNAGVAKDVWIYYGQASSNSYSNFTGEITVSGNIISLTNGGKNHVYVGAQMSVLER